MFRAGHKLGKYKIEGRLADGAFANVCRARDTVLITSDGLFDSLHVSEIIECIRKGKLTDAAQRLANGDQQRMIGSDDLTFVLFRLSRPQTIRR